MKFIESNIQFDFSVAVTVHPHDTTQTKGPNDCQSDGNTYWPGVDFGIQDASHWIWLEVKHWIKQPGDFRKKINAEHFREYSRSKFLGKTSYLAWNEKFEISAVHYVMLLEAKYKKDSALLGTLNQQMKSKMNNAGSLKIKTFVMDLETWNKFYSKYEAKKLPTNH